MDPKAAAKQLAELTRELGACYTLVAAIVARLPVPMNLPVQADDPGLALRSLSLAWELAGQDALHPVTIARVREMITAWAAAYEITVIASGSGPAPWRLRALEDAAARIRDAVADVSRQLDGNWTQTRLTDAERAEVKARMTRGPGNRRRPR